MRVGRSAKERFGDDLPTRSAIEKVDAALARRLLGRRDGILFDDAHALARALDKLAGSVPTQD